MGSEMCIRDSGSLTETVVIDTLIRKLAKAVSTKSRRERGTSWGVVLRTEISQNVFNSINML